MKESINSKNIENYKMLNMYNEDFKITIEEHIEKIIRNIQQLNERTVKINYYKKLLGLKLTTSNISYIDYQYSLYKANLLDIKNNKVIIKNVQNFKKIIQMILNSDFLKERFNIYGHISKTEEKNLINSIVNSCYILNFEKDKEISRFIFAYIKKFIG